MPALADLRRFHALIEGYITSIKSAPSSATSLRFILNAGIEQEINRTAKSLGWPPLIFIRKADFLSVNGAYGGDMFGCKLSGSAGYSDSLLLRMGARRVKTKIAGKTATILELPSGHFEATAQMERDNIISKLQTWVARAAAEIAGAPVPSGSPAGDTPAETPAPTAADSQAITAEKLATELGLTSDTVNRYAKRAGVPTPGRGQKNFRYPPAHIQEICALILEHGNAYSKEATKKLLAKLAE
jgi:hypothetical protein